MSPEQRQLRGRPFTGSAGGGGGHRCIPVPRLAGGQEESQSDRVCYLCTLFASSVSIRGGGAVRLLPQGLDSGLHSPARNAPCTLPIRAPLQGRPQCRQVPAVVLCWLVWVRGAAAGLCPGRKPCRRQKTRHSGAAWPLAAVDWLWRRVRRRSRGKMLATCSASCSRGWLVVFASSCAASPRASWWLRPWASPRPSQSWSVWVSRAFWVGQVLCLPRASDIWSAPGPCIQPPPGVALGAVDG